MKFLLIILFISLLSCVNSNDKIKQENKSIKRDSTKQVIKDTVIIEEDIDDYDVSYKELDSANINIKFYPKGNYSVLKSTIKNSRNTFTQLYLNSTDSVSKQNIIDSARYYVTNILLNKILPFWYGTAWDFDGYTSVPNQGVIACGYYVSTTLRDAGFNINRYHLAQQSPINEAKTIQLSNNVKIFNIETDSLKERLLTELKPGLYFVGLDCHVGYLWIDDNQPFFIHSNYVFSAVELEYAETSEAFINNEQYIIADITFNDNLILKWILNGEIDIIK